MCMEGKVELHYAEGKSVLMQKGDSILIPAILKELLIVPSQQSTMLEVYMKP
jgi:mannose-6-phosphate isomerase